MGNSIKVYILLLFTIIAFSADINKTIVDNNISFYKSMLESLEKKETLNEELRLQKTLLQKIIEVQNKKSVIKKIQLPKNQKEYIELFNQFLSDIIKKEELKEKIETNNKKLDSLKNQFKEQNSTKLTKELFFALYNKENTLFKRELKLKNKEIEQIEKLLINSFKNITLNK